MKQEKRKDKTIKVSLDTHESLRVLAFKKDLKIKKLIEVILKEYVQK